LTQCFEKGFQIYFNLFVFQEESVDFIINFLKNSYKSIVLLQYFQQNFCILNEYFIFQKYNFMFLIQILQLHSLINQMLILPTYQIPLNLIFQILKQYLPLLGGPLSHFKQNQKHNLICLQILNLGFCYFQEVFLLVFMVIVEFVFVLSVGVDGGVDLLVGERQGVVLREGDVFFDRDVRQRVVVLLFFHKGVKEWDIYLILFLVIKILLGWRFWDYYLGLIK
jgi:hypothetical protein